MTFRLRNRIPPALLQRFTLGELQMLAESLEIVATEPNQQLVTFSMTPPNDTSHAWQQTDAEGRYIGSPKRYTPHGTWV